MMRAIAVGAVLALGGCISAVEECVGAACADGGGVGGGGSGVGGGAGQCAVIFCSANQVCDPAVGKCKCNGAECQPGQACGCPIGNPQCQPAAHVCVSNLCSGVTCTTGSACDPGGYCKCNGAICLTGQMCECPPGQPQCAPAARICKSSSACVGAICTGGTTCDPNDGLCKCGNAVVCTANQICQLGPPPVCVGGGTCSPACTNGLSCDASTLTCKCGGTGGLTCAAGESCVSTPLSKSCRQPCNMLAPVCPSGTYCYFDSSATVPQAYCAAPTDTKTDGQACLTATACFVNSPPRALVCRGLALGQAGICRAPCDVSVGAAGCIQVPAAQLCIQIPQAPTNVGACQP